MKIFKKILIKLLCIFPFSLGILPYKLSLFFAKFFLQTQKSSLWARNSYVEKNLSPGLSDIDFTYFHTRETSHEEIQSQLRKFFTLSFFFPLWGEINSYNEKDIQDFLPFLNPLEFQRDQKLQNLFPSKKMSPTLEEKIVFLLRMLKADAKNLLTHPEKREKKWRRHCESCQISYRQNPSEAVWKEMIAQLNYSLDKDIFDDFLKLNEESHSEVDQFFLPLDSVKRRSFILLFPLRWLVVSLRNHEFEKDMIRVVQFSNDEKKLLYFQISWEIWGIYSQFHTLSLKNDLSLHLENIAKILAPFSDGQKMALSEGIQKLKTIIEDYRQE